MCVCVWRFVSNSLNTIERDQQKEVALHNCCEVVSLSKLPFHTVCFTNPVLVESDSQWQHWVTAVETSWKIWSLCRSRSTFPHWTIYPMDNSGLQQVEALWTLDDAVCKNSRNVCFSSDKLKTKIIWAEKSDFCCWGLSPACLFWTHAWLYILVYTERENPRCVLCEPGTRIPGGAVWDLCVNQAWCIKAFSGQ